MDTHLAFCDEQKEFLAKWTGDVEKFQHTAGKRQLDLEEKEKALCIREAIVTKREKLTSTLRRQLTVKMARANEMEAELKMLREQRLQEARKIQQEQEAKAKAKPQFESDIALARYLHENKTVVKLTFQHEVDVSQYIDGIWVATDDKTPPFFAVPGQLEVTIMGGTYIQTVSALSYLDSFGSTTTTIMLLKPVDNRWIEFRVVKLKLNVKMPQRPLTASFTAI